MTKLLSPAVLAEDLRALADVLPFDEATRAVLEQSADRLDELDELLQEDQPCAS